MAAKHCCQRNYDCFYFFGGDIQRCYTGLFPYAAMAQIALLAANKKRIPFSFCSFIYGVECDTAHLQLSATFLFTSFNCAEEKSLNVEKLCLRIEFSCKPKSPVK